MLQSKKHDKPNAIQVLTMAQNKSNLLGQCSKWERFYNSYSHVKFSTSFSLKIDSQ